MHIHTRVMLKKQSGFTLVELIVVIAIIAVLSAVVAPSGYRAIVKAGIVRTLGSFRTIKAATLQYQADTGQWVASHYITNANGPFFRDPGVAGWDGPYLESYEKSPVVQPAVSGGGLPGWYYVLADDQRYDSTFDLDSDGTADIQDAISVCCYGFPANIAYRMDEIIDGAALWGYLGTMNVIRIWTTGGTDDYYLIAQMIGQTGVNRLDR